MLFAYSYFWPPDVHLFIYLLHFSEKIHAKLDDVKFCMHMDHKHSNKFCKKTFHALKIKNVLKTLCMTN